MNIDNITLAYIQGVIKVADLVKIGNVAVEAGRIRGMDENQQVFIFHTEGIPDFAFGSIGLNRLSEFSARLNLAQAATNFTMDATVEDKNGVPFVRVIQMKGRGIKADYRCANPATIMAPKNIKSPFIYQFTIADECANYLHKGQVAYKSDSVSFDGTADGVSMIMSDVNNDSMTYEASDSCNDIAENSDGLPFKFSYKYPIKILLPLFKAATIKEININTQGIMRINVGGFDFHIWALQGN